jgi:hypothetical protein
MLDSGFKRTYELVNLLPKATVSVIKMMEVNRDHRMVALEFPGMRCRPASMLLSNGIRFLLLEPSFTQLQRFHRLSIE